MSGQTHQADPRILNRRTLERDHPRLAQLLQPGMRVLDVGCGTGAITAGIAKAVAPGGSVIGLDRDESLVNLARQQHTVISNLSFAVGDVLCSEYKSCFDVVTAARALQWISQPMRALRQMKNAVRPGGWIVVLDYNHLNHSWEPDPPASFQRFYRAFLDWREANGWDNQMADGLPDLFRAAGITDIRVYVDDEVSERGDPDFTASAELWAHVIESLGPHVVVTGFLSEQERAEAEREYRNWATTSLQRQVLAIRTVTGQS